MKFTHVTQSSSQYYDEGHEGCEEEEKKLLKVIKIFPTKVILSRKGFQIHPFVHV
jgi:hypothetical protein